MSEKVNLTAGRIAALTCPPGEQQHFLRDTRAPWLAVRVTAAGVKSYVFESKLHGRTIRITIGSTQAWTIDGARQDANLKKTRVDQGIDPRSERRAMRSNAAKSSFEHQTGSVLVGTAWEQYLLHGRPRKKKAWKPRYVEDLRRMCAPGHEHRLRGRGLTKPGPLHVLMQRRLCELDEDFVRSWCTEVARRSNALATRALAVLSGFLSWCGRQPEYRQEVHRDAAKPSAHADVLVPLPHRRDALLASQLPAWFAAALDDPNLIGSTYLMGLLLTGARREELARLKHEDMDIRWDAMTIADKYQDTRAIPIGPHFKKMVLALPRLPENPYVFWSRSSASGHIAEPRSVMERILRRAEIGHVSVHGLRRSFSKLGEAARVPLGAIAQIMGHQPSALAERYRWREMDELRAYLTEIEQFILHRAAMLPEAAERPQVPVPAREREIPYLTS